MPGATKPFSNSIAKMAWAGLLVSFLFGSCLVSPHHSAESFRPTGADTAIAGYHVRSYFHGGIGKEWKSTYISGALLNDSSIYYDPPSSMRITGTDTPSNIIEKVLDPPENVCGDVFV